MKYLIVLLFVSCSVKLTPRKYYTNVNRGCMVTTLVGFSRTDTLVEGCECKYIK